VIAGAVIERRMLLQIRIAEKERTLVRRDLHEAMIDQMVGLTLTKLGSISARKARRAWRAERKYELGIIM
jgi:hypothetical protein